MNTRPLIIGFVLAVALVAAVPCAAQAEEETTPTGKLMVVWTSADPDVADKVCLMYTHAAKKYSNS